TRRPAAGRSPTAPASPPSTQSRWWRPRWAWKSKAPSPRKSAEPEVGLYRHGTKLSRERRQGLRPAARRAGGTRRIPPPPGRRPGPASPPAAAPSDPHRASGGRKSAEPEVPLYRHGTKLSRERLLRLSPAARRAGGTRRIL